MVLRCSSSRRRRTQPFKDRVTWFTGASRLRAVAADGSLSSAMGEEQDVVEVQFHHPQSNVVLHKVQSPIARK
jgi:hypothetical protein